MKNREKLRRLSVLVCTALVFASLGSDLVAQSITVTQKMAVRGFGGRPAGYELCFGTGTNSSVVSPFAMPPGGTFSIDMGGPCYFFAGLPPSNALLGPGFLTSLAALADIRSDYHNRVLLGKVDSLTQKIDSHIATSNSRQTFIENQLSAELQARMDKWPAELLADRDAYDAFKTQLVRDLEEVLELQREVEP